MASYQPYGRGRRYDLGANRAGRQPEDYDYDDRGFFDRAGDEVRSWFGDDEAERRRRWDARYAEREGGYGGGWGPGYDRDNRDDYRRGQGSSGSGYGPYGQRADYVGRSSRQGWGGRGYGDIREDYGARGPRRFSWEGREDEGGWRGGDASWRGQTHAHTDYHDWRDRQMQAFDRDYDDYRSERQGRFDSDFGSWRQQRSTQRQRLGEVREHMEIVGSDGAHVGTVDKVKGDRIKLTRTDTDAAGRHHYVPCSWVEAIEGETVKLNCTADEAHRKWAAERENQGGSAYVTSSYVTSDWRS